jgi:predicted HTH domain antitoxin
MAAATALVGADDNTVEDPKVTMGHPGLRVPGAVSLSKVMGLSHFVLNQVHDVLRREREEINEEWLCLSVLVSLLKKRMTSEKEMAEARQKHLNVMEILLDRRQAVANKLDTQA